MLIIPPSPRRKHRGRIPEVLSAPTFGVRVTRVVLFAPVAVTWVFSSPYAGDGNCAEMTVSDGTSGWMSPVFLEAIDEVSIRAFYNGVTLSLTSLWQLLTQIEGVTFADGLLAVPQGGVVVAG